MYVISALSGLSIWITLSFISGKNEAWDSPLYDSYGIPLMSLITGILGFVLPIRPYRWGIAMVASQAVFLVFIKPTANLLPLGIFLFGVYSIPCIITAYIGAFVRNKIMGR